MAAITAHDNRQIMKQPVIDVGILTADKIVVVFRGDFIKVPGSERVTGEVTFSAEKFKSDVRFKPSDPESCEFEIRNVVIGKGFHWERREDQAFKGSLKIIKEDDKITAVNSISVEEYLQSVISSEMSPESPMETLKAHAVVSRSWLLSQLESKSKIELTSVVSHTKDELIMWFDRESHDNYDVCADDHCQRYQGITKTYNKNASEAVTATRGEVLMYENDVCDARYSKCCGGVTEDFENVWEEVPHPYLKSVPDLKESTTVADLSIEKNAVEWIKSSPPAWCNTQDKTLLSKALNDYDMETVDFFRWEVAYTAEKLCRIIKRRIDVDFGEIEDLIPMERGKSGRIIKLKIVGTEKSLIIGKELFIRKALSESHLYSSAFFVEKSEANGEKVFKITGAGWGHGVGLCQIGAAVMGSEGKSYAEILGHYYPDAQLEKVYK